MKKKCIVLAILVCFAVSAMAQSSKREDFWGFGLGMQSGNFDKINTLLQNENLPTISNFAFPSFSFFWGTQNGRFLNIVDGGVATQRNRQNNFTTSTMIGGFKVLLGYDVVAKEKLSLYPLLGIGFGNASINIAQQTNPASINAYLASSPTEKTLYYSGSLAVGLGLGANYKFERATIGFLTGYNYPVGQGRWRVEGQRLDDKLRTVTEGFYFKIFFASLYD